jgi:transposase InsO family protein
MRDRGALEALSRPSGRPPVDPRDREVERLKREHLGRELDKARGVIEVQGKLSALLSSSPPTARLKTGTRRADRRRHRRAHADRRRECRLSSSRQPRVRHYRRHRMSPMPPRPEAVPSPTTGAVEGGAQGAAHVLHDDDHIDAAPASVYAKLLDEGTYLASVSTMYRLLRAEHEVRGRRRQATHPAAVKPELVATQPNPCWSWDITKLLGPERRNYFYLYVVLDIFSRYVVGWMLARAEQACLAGC